MAKDYKIFISHSWRHPEDIRNLHRLLKKRGYLNVAFQESTQDKPINSINAPYIKRVLTNKITSSDIVIAIAGMYASHSEWIAWELEKASDNSIPIIGVIPRGRERVSRTVTQYSKENVRWNTESIVSAIRKHSK